MNSAYVTPVPTTSPVGPAPFSCPGAGMPGGLRAGNRTSYIFGLVFPSSSTSQMSGASGVDSAMLLFGPTEAPVSVGARAWHSELEVWALTIS